LTYRFPTALSDNATRLKLTEYGCPPGVIARLTPLVVLPVSILSPILATRFFGKNCERGRGALRQFKVSYAIRVTLVILLDVLAVRAVGAKYGGHGGVFGSEAIFWLTLVASTALSSLASSMQSNAQMTFFASRADPLIGGSYMTLLNTFANFGGSWPASPVLWILSKFSDNDSTDAYFPLQLLLSSLGLLWIYFIASEGGTLTRLGQEPLESWIVKDKEADWIESDDDDDENNNESRV